MSDDNLTPPPPPPAAPPASPYVAPAAGPKQALSLTSFILGLVGFIFSWIPFVGIIGFLAGVAAVILGFIAKNKEPAAPRWMWIVGVIAGFVAIAISIVYLIIIIIIAVGAASSVSNLPGY
ncbi:MAG: hypothetical protein JWO18_472 [Microbacteriaceae bacterium]|jgi:hypothetical protein|nr:hypothetical protein [Microbacteriaceae bacterium]